MIWTVKKAHSRSTIPARDSDNLRELGTTGACMYFQSGSQFFQLGVEKLTMSTLTQTGTALVICHEFSHGDDTNAWGKSTS